MGVLGVVSQATLALRPMFKRSLMFVKRDDSDFAEQVAVWGGLHEFGDMAWLPLQGKVIYRQDDHVPITTTGNDLNNYLGFRENPTLGLITAKAVEERLEENSSDTARCLAAWLPAAIFELQAYGFTNDGVFFTRYPVVGFQCHIQEAGTCISSREDEMLSSCTWDPRIRSPFFYNSGFSVALSMAPTFVADMLRLRDLIPHAFCDFDAKMGILLRYVKVSSAYLGKAEDSVDFDITYYRSYTEGALRAHSDVVDEQEQLALRKYGVVPHWGKSRNFAFDGAITKYPKAGEFLKVKDKYDPDGIFSSEWSNQVLDIHGSPNIVEKGCAIEGLCVCSEDSHCAPEHGFFCRPEMVYTKARVCSSRPGGDLRDEL